MSDFRLQVFYSVAKNLSFTKASQELYISQPAITKHIHKLEDEYQVRLFERQGNKIELTKAGCIMLKHCESILSEYNQLEYAMHLFNNEHVGQLRLGASTTISQYLLPPFLASFIDHFPKADISLINGNSRYIEHELIEHNIELGLIEGVTRLATLTYTPFFEDELIVVTNPNNPLVKQGSISLEEFIHAPLILRERGSGTLDVIEKNLLEQNIKTSDLNIRMYLGSTEAIKLFIQNSDCICILSKLSVMNEIKNNSLIQVNVPNLCFKRDFCFVQAPGPQIPLVEKFINFVMNKHASI